MDALESQIRRNVLLGLLTELYEKNVTDAISVREWLESKLGELGEDTSLGREGVGAIVSQRRYTNHYLCLKDSTRWDSAWSCMCNDRCPTCCGVTQPYATTRNADGSETIHNQAVFNEANAVRR